MRQVISKAGQAPKVLVFPGDHPDSPCCAHLCGRRHCIPSLARHPDKIRALADELELNLEGIRLVDHTNNDRLPAYVRHIGSVETVEV